MSVERPVTILTGRAPRLTDSLRELHQFRSLLFRFAGRDIVLRYRQTALGPVWVILQPLLAAGAFALVFGGVADLPSDGVAYLPFALSGMVLWTAFSANLNKSTSSLIANSSMVAKVYFPRLALPLSSVGGTAFDAGIGFGLLLAVALVTGTALSTTALLAPVVLVGTVLFSTGLGLMTCALSVAYRDMVFLTTAVLQVLLYVSPIGYGLSAVPDHLQIYFALNPLSGYLEAFRWCLLGTAPPGQWAVLYSMAATVAALGLGLRVFNRKQVSFADIL